MAGTTARIRIIAAAHTSDTGSEERRFLRTSRATALLFVGLLLAAGCGNDDCTASRPTPTAGAAATATSAASPSPTPTATATIALGDPLSGGETTVDTATVAAFGQPARNLPLDQRTRFFVGNSLFNRTWVTAPSSTQGSDGLGPLFNARSCSSCHFRDGRGRPPVEPDEQFIGLLFRVSVPGTAADGGPRGDPNYGTQLNLQSILGVPAEARATLTYSEIPGAYLDGESYSLRSPRYDFAQLAYGPLDPAVQISPRTAPQIIGLGLLAAVDESVLTAAADPTDADGNGISGRPNYVWDLRAGAARLGRFGWKANQPTIEQQTTGAFLGDIGLTTPLFPDENCTPAEIACATAPNGGAPEIDQQKVDAVTFYTRFLAVPGRRDVNDPEVRRGEELFHAVGCASCHTATLLTGEVPDAAPLSGQRIHPYTDLLLHDMGPDLADDRPDFEADGREWRTPPLWGIGLIRTVNRHDLLLHDGRARGVAEAILWHGGEGEAAREAFRALSRDERAAVVRFLESL